MSKDIIEINKEFIDIIIGLLRDNGWRHSDLAEKSGVSRTTLSRIINGKITTLRPVHHKAITNLVGNPEYVDVEVIRSEIEKMMLDQFRQLDDDHKIEALSAINGIKYRQQGRTVTEIAQ